MLFRSFLVRTKMTTIRRFCCNDLLRFASVNLDHLTETVSSLSLSSLLFPSSPTQYNAIWIICLTLRFHGWLFQFNMSFYMTYLARWPDYFHVAEGPGNQIMGYSKLLKLLLFWQLLPVYSDATLSQVLVMDAF